MKTATTVLETTSNLYVELIANDHPNSLLLWSLFLNQKLLSLLYAAGAGAVVVVIVAADDEDDDWLIDWLIDWSIDYGLLYMNPSKDYTKLHQLIISSLAHVKWF